ncbi:F-box/kelch-repeat protein At3g06240-like [Bidens hawaiensis]|uniref:F-box/kelch-repeat protein At3g06240-like n=1 Tax=Bidens hawaiensis TaxID=980011 RepID=UPI00404AB6EC
MSDDDLYLCEELILDILSWLPTKTLLRFRSVSKSFRARISSHDFIRLHTLRAEKRFLMIHVHDAFGRTAVENMYTISSSAGITPMDYPFGSRIGVVASCNGIMCVCERDIGAIHLWNPSTRRILTVHELPSWSIGIHGFGFDPAINDYKILRIFVVNADTFVYTIRTRAWRRIAPPAIRISHMGSYQQCLFDGALHWVVGGWHSRHPW